MITNNTPSLLLALPEDVQRRLLAGCRYEDLFSLAAACRAYRDVVNSPRFTRARRSHGFVEREVVLLGTRRHNAVDIRSAQTRAVKLSITGELELNVGGTTTDGRRVFVTCKNSRHSWKKTCVYALDAMSRQWTRFAYLHPDRALHCMEWYAGRLYVAGGFTGNNGRTLFFLCIQRSDWIVGPSTSYASCRLLCIVGCYWGLVAHCRWFIRKYAADF